LEKFADDYLSRGWSVIPVQHKGKQPTLKDWTQSQITLDTLDKHFKAEPRNIGICLGEASGGLVDVDLDWPEAASLAQYILPSTGAVFGRPGSPASHRLYICQGIDRRESYRDPTKSAGKGMIVEIRTDRCQTVVPPSVHETGEDIEWETADVAPATVEPEQLRRAIARLAAVSLLARYWPAGSRQDATLPLAGALLRGGMPEDEAREFIKRVAEAAGDDEVDKRVGAVDDTARNLKANEPVTGLPRLVDFFGQPVVDCIADWLGLGGDTHDVISDLNENHAMVLVGGQASILKEKISPEGRPEIEMISPSAFKTYYCNKMVSVDDKTISIANHWITHRDRRSYEGLVFMPGATPQNYYNLWRGFAVEPRRGGCNRYLDHVWANICRGDDDLYEWVLGWMAEIVQQPTHKSGSALAIRGLQGTGKTKFAEVFGSLFGSHYVVASDPRYITGRFNSHLSTCLLLHAEEAFWAGDHRAEGKLKDLVTGDHHFIEHKGKEPIRVPNHVRLLVTGNPDWVVPAALEERRFAVLTIGTARMQDADYFAGIDKEMENGGRSALLHHLLNEVDLSSVNLRKIPATAALFEQKVASMTPEQKWVLDLLMCGQLPGDYEGTGATPYPLLVDHYVDHAKQQGVPRRATETQLAHALEPLLPPFQRAKRSYKKMVRWDQDGDPVHRKLRGTVYELPPLSSCRQHFETIAKSPIDWSASGKPAGDDDASGNDPGWLPWED
jgi:hypothetical protein